MAKINANIDSKMAKVNANIDGKMAKINSFDIQLLINVGFPVLPGKPRIHYVDLPRAFVNGVEGELAAVGAPARHRKLGERHS